MKKYILSMTLLCLLNSPLQASYNDEHQINTPSPLGQSDTSTTQSCTNKEIDNDSIYHHAIALYIR